MERLTLQEVVNAVQGQVFVKGNTEEFNEVSTDTRKIEEGNIFIALKGANFNGNDYAASASEKGANILILDEIKFNSIDLKPSTTVILVKETKQALLDLAEYYRSKLPVKIVGITGSTGKTSTKDLVAGVLSARYKVFKTAGNFNNEIGLPLMIFKLTRQHEVAILEMGMSDFNEIHRMAKAARPDLAIMTNIGISHIENLKTRDGILKAKLEIVDFFKKDGTLIVNSDDDKLCHVEKALPEHLKEMNVITTGIEFKGDYSADKMDLREDGISFDLLEKGEKVGRFQSPVLGRHNVSNALLAIACGRKLGMSYEEVATGLKHIETTSMRLDIIKCNGNTIINDAYNASPDSMKAAMDFMKNLKCNKRIAVLGSMMELGHEAWNAHRECGQYAAENGVDILISLGEFSKAYEEGFQQAKDASGVFMAFENHDEATDWISGNLTEGDVVLVKASRAMKFETIVENLKKKSN